MDVCVPVGVADLLVVDFGEPVVGCDSTAVGEDQTTDRIVDRAVLLDAPVICSEVAVDELLVVDQGLVSLSDILMLLSVEDVCLGDILVSGLGQNGLDTVLDVLDGNLVILDLVGKACTGSEGQHLDNVLVVILVRGDERTHDGVLNFLDIKGNGFTRSFQYLIHTSPSVLRTYITQI